MEEEFIGNIAVYRRGVPPRATYGVSLVSPSGELLYVIPVEWNTVTGVVDSAARRLAALERERASLAEVP